MLVTDVQERADFSAQISSLRQRTYFVGGRPLVANYDICRCSFGVYVEILVLEDQSSKNALGGKWH
jgi:hypothetical protein